MKLSIILPFQKGLDYLQDCLDSILAQNIEAYEVLIIGDNPKENPEEMIREAQKHLPISYEILQGKTGVGAARNRGLEKAKGEYIFFLDSDDFLLEGTLEKLLSFSENKKGRLIFCTLEKTCYKRESFLEIYLQPSQSTGKKKKESGYRGFSEMSVLGILIPRATLEEKALRFNESLQFFADMPFVMELLAKEKEFLYLEDAVYIKRIHNDAVHFPSLNQTIKKGKEKEYFKSYAEAKEIIRSYGESHIDYFERQFCMYILEAFAGKNGTNVRDWSEGTKRLFAGELKWIKPKVIRSFRWQERQLLKLLKGGKSKKALRIGQAIIFMRRELFEKRYWIKRILYRLIFRKMQLKENCIIFESFFGKSYSDNCKYIYEYLLEYHAEDYEFVWVLDRKKGHIPGNPITIKYMGLRYFYYMARAKYFVNNMQQPEWFRKRPNTVFLETWHGTPLKKLVFDREDVWFAKPQNKMHFYEKVKQWDYLVSDNRFSTEVFQSAFCVEREKILEYGYPRNDILVAPNSEEIKKEIKQKLEIPKDKKVILYAPTHREEMEEVEPDNSKMLVPLDLDLMQEALKEQYIVLFKSDYFEIDKLDLEGKKNFLYDVRAHEDISELYLISDICITDYSSVFFDYANLKRPILFYANDFEKYRDYLRGFYIDMETELPGPLLATTEEVIYSIFHLEKVVAEYAEVYHQFYDRFCMLDDGFAAKRIIEKVFL